MNYYKPNEDYIIVDDINQIYIICDGVTRDLINGKYPDPSPSYLAAKTFSESVHEKILLNIRAYDPFQLLEDVIDWGNHKISELNSERIRGHERFLPGTVGVVSVIINERFYCMYLGDCSVWHIRNNSADRIDSLTRVIKSHVPAHYTREELYNNPRNPMGYGVFTGETESLSFLQKAETDIRTGDVLMMVTDGMDLIFQSDYFSRLKDEDPAALINISEKMETDTNTTSDDKSIIILKVI